jgi:hypothetical protein
MQGKKEGTCDSALSAEEYKPLLSVVDSQRYANLERI